VLGSSRNKNGSVALFALERGVATAWKYGFRRKDRARRLRGGASYTQCPDWIERLADIIRVIKTSERRVGKKVASKRRKVGKKETDREAGHESKAPEVQRDSTV